MTAALMGRHSLDRTPDGLVTTFVGDLRDDVADLPTRLLPVIKIGPRGSFTPVQNDAALANSAPSGDSSTDVEAARDTERTVAARVATGRTPVTRDLLKAVLEGLKRL
ncbi:hypothetical protein [Saccharopolyspora hattusasensis]|uniref:hypothetical protein n=1 Tax=Saccharopolyspora hattusasensis TaxID=1128679 RepID=UPI003D99DF15